MYHHPSGHAPWHAARPHIVVARRAALALGDSVLEQAIPIVPTELGGRFWASPELLEFYDTPDMHPAFSVLDWFLATPKM